MVRKLLVGQLQAVAVTNVGLHDVIPEPEAFSTPLLFRDEAEVQCALGHVRDRLESALEARGLVAVQWSRVGTASLFCTKPFQTPEEMGQARVFAWEGDPGMVKAWRSAGLRPVVLSSTDLLAALTTGMVDCVSSVPLYMLTTRAFEKARHLVDLPIGPIIGATIVRKEVWERIPPDVRPRLVQIAREEGAKVDAEIRRLNANAVEAMKGQGLSVDPVDPVAWRAVMEKTWAVIRGEVVPAEFFDVLLGARDACRRSVSGRR
jgi:TRAP-type C4-dicarboxylate transport system substrate-binding protein